MPADSSRPGVCPEDVDVTAGRDRSSCSRRTRQRKAIRRAPAFAGDALVAPPTTGWPTNGGNWYNRRYSPLDRDRSQQRRESERRVAHALAAARASARSTRAKRSRSSTTASSTSSRARTTCSRSASTSGEILWEYRANLDPANNAVCCGWTSRGVGLGDGKVFVGQLDGKLVALDQRTGRRRVVRASRALAGRLHDHERAALLRRPRLSRASRAASAAFAAA